MSSYDEQILKLSRELRKKIRKKYLKRENKRNFSKWKIKVYGKLIIEAARRRKKIKEDWRKVFCCSRRKQARKNLKMNTKIPTKLILIGLLLLIDFSESRAVSWATYMQSSASQILKTILKNQRLSSSENYHETKENHKKFLRLLNNLADKAEWDGSSLKWNDKTKQNFTALQCSSLLLLPFYSCLPFSGPEMMLLWGNWKRK